MRRGLTESLRAAAVWAWSLGLGVVALNVLSIPIFRWRASAAYLLFSLATLLTVWAEKREFGSRIFLYRLHDAVIYSPWKYLLLYFLWISVFSPFTAEPLASLVYASNGWMSLFAIGISAQFIFCERSARGVLLHPTRLRVAFGAYAFTVTGLLALFSLYLFFALDLQRPVPVDAQENLLRYFLMGLPFLLWDFVKDGRRLLPRIFSLLPLWLGSVVTLLFGRRLYHLALALVVGGVLALFLYKRARPRRGMLFVGALASLAVVATLGLTALLQRQTYLRRVVGHARFALENRVNDSFAPAWQALVESRFMGKGVGATELLGVWARVSAEGGLVGLALYSAFFLSLLLALYRVRHSPRVVISNVGALAVLIFLGLLSHYVDNPYAAHVWVWYSLWAVFAATPQKRKFT